jgi:O-antigen/teichoic acid export membrane protein
MQNTELDTQDDTRIPSQGDPATATLSRTARLLKRLPQAQILAVADQVVVSGGTFLATVAIGRWAGPDQLGAYSIGVSVLFAALGVQEATITLPYTIRRNRTGSDTRMLAGQTLANSALLSAVLISCLVVLAAGLLFSRSHQAAPGLLGALAWLAPFLLLRELARQFCFSHLRVTDALLMDCLALVLQVGGLLWLGLSGNMSAVGVCMTNGTGLAVVSAGWLYLNRSLFRMSPTPLSDTVRNDWGLGGWLLAAQIAVSIQAFAASWLVVIVKGATAAGIYSACIALVSIASPVVAGSVNILLPRTAMILAREGATRLRYHLVRDAALLGAVMAGFCGLLSITSAPITHLLYHGPTFAGHERTIQILALAWLITAVGIPASNALASLERPRRIFWASLAAAATNVLLSIWLIVDWGVIGAALAFLGGSLAGTIGRWAGFLQVASPGLHRATLPFSYPRR